MSHEHQQQRPGLVRIVLGIGFIEFLILFLFLLWSKA